MDLESKKVTVLLVTKTLPNLTNGLKSLSPLRKVVESLVALVGLQGVEPGKFFRSWKTHVTLHEQIEEPNHVSLSIGHHLEYN